MGLNPWTVGSADTVRTELKYPYSAIRNEVVLRIQKYFVSRDSNIMRNRGFDVNRVIEIANCDPSLPNF